MSSRARRQSFSTAGRVSGVLSGEAATGYSWAQGVAISQATIGTLSGGNGSFKVSSAAPALPSGLVASISGASLVINGTPSSALSLSIVRFIVTDTANSVPVTFQTAITVTAVLSASTQATGLSWVVSTPITPVTPVLAQNGSPPYQYNIDNLSGATLPGGLSMNSSTGQITGTPTTPESLSTHAVRVQDSATAVVYAYFTATSVGSTPLPSLGVDAQALNGGGVITNVADPLGTGLSVIQGHINNPVYPTSREMRAESFTTGYSSPFNDRLDPGVEVWIAGGFHIDPSFDIARGGAGDNSLLVWQTHTEASGDTQPDLAFSLRGQGGSPIMRWRSSYNASQPSTWVWNGGSNPDTTATTTIHSEALMAAGQRYRFILQWIPGYLVSHGPLINLWRSLNGAAFSQIVTNYTGLNTYNITGWAPVQGRASYKRQGLYKWNGSTWDSNPIRIYSLPYYYARGSNLYSRAEASLLPWA
jgi:hypothetical protein